MKKETKDKIKHFWSNGLSVDETKFSVFIILLIIGFGYGLYDHYTNGDIALNLLELIKILIFSIAGLNIAKGGVRGVQENTGDRKTQAR